MSYTATGTPADGAGLQSAEMRAEFLLIQAETDKMPTVTGNGGKIVAINAAGTAEEAIPTTGTGSGVRATSPTLVTPALGTPVSGTLTNCTDLPAGGLSATATDKLFGRSTAGAGVGEEIACTAFARSILDDADEATFKATVNLEIGTDVQAYDADLATWAGVTPGTGVATALAVAVGSAGAPVVNGGALGTPASGALDNCTSNTETAANNSTQLATTAYADRLTDGTLGGAFTTLDATGNATLGNAPTDVHVVNGILGIGNQSPTVWGTGAPTIDFKGTSAGSPTRAGAIKWESQSGTAGAAAIYCDAGQLNFYTGTTNYASLTAKMRLHASGGLSINNTTDPGAGNLSITGAISATTTIKTGGYTVSTLPAGATGDRAYVTDATAPTYLGALTGGGAVVCPVFKNASAWVST